MNEFLKGSSFKVLVIAVVVLLGLLIYTVSAGGSLIASLLGFVSSPMQSVATELTGNVTEFLDLDGFTKSELKELVSSLQEENNALLDRLVEYDSVMQENQQLKTQLHISQEEPEIEMRSASVIGRDPNDVFYGFSINAGTLAGVSTGDPVITSRGLVGIVVQASATTSKVNCLLSEDVEVSAISIDKQEVGVVRGNVTMASSGLVRLGFLSSETKLEPGDIITTSGRGGVYPPKLKIGQVQSIEKSETDVSRYAVLKPFEDLSEVREVQVITSFPGQGEDENVVELDPGQDNQEDAE